MPASPPISGTATPPSSGGVMDAAVYLYLIDGYNDYSSLPKLPVNAISAHAVTAQKNTALHIAAGRGYERLGSRICELFPNMIFDVNSKGDTPFHCAARGGSVDLLAALIRHGKEMVSNRELQIHEMRNRCGNTPLHEAARKGHSRLASKLMNADHQLGGVLNELGESAIYVAAERGELATVQVLLRYPACDVAVAGPNGQTALHAAVCQKYEIAELIVEKRPDLSRQVDATESSPLHYAASIGDHKMIQLLLNHDASTAYLADKDGLSPIHVAATMGYTEVIAMLIKRCPDSMELIDKKGRNFLHLAIENRKSKVVKCVLRSPALGELINEPDGAGNTPLHLATMRHNMEIVHLLLADMRVDTRARNHEGLTPLDLAYSCTDPSIRLRMHKLMEKLVSAGSRFSPQRADFIANKQHRKDDDEINRCRALAINVAIVAVLIATVTFAAGFTLPGGYNSNDGPNEGMAVLAKKAAFKAFLISNAIAMVFSITVTCLLIYTGSFDHDVRLHAISTAIKFLWVALGGMVVAFATGTYVVVAPCCEWLGVLICCMSCSVPFIAWMIACWPALDSLKLVKAAKKQGETMVKHATFEMPSFQIPHSTVIDFRTPVGSANYI